MQSAFYKYLYNSSTSSSWSGMGYLPKLGFRTLYGDSTSMGVLVIRLVSQTSKQPEHQNTGRCSGGAVSIAAAWNKKAA